MLNAVTQAAIKPDEQIPTLAAALKSHDTINSRQNAARFSCNKKLARKT